MTHIMLDRKLRLADVAFAIEATPKTVRNWFERNQVELTFGGGHDGGWREFSIADVAVLAVVRKLVEFGMNVKAASDFANAALMSPDSGILSREDCPPAEIASYYAGQMLFFWLVDGEWKFGRCRQSDSVLPPADTFLVVLLDPLLRRAIERAVVGSANSAPSNRAAAVRDAAASVAKLGLAAEDAADAAGVLLEAIKRSGK